MIKHRTEKNCLNCGSEIKGKFCSECGQENIELHESVGHFLSHSIGHYLHFDSKFFNSIIPLLTKPGYLTLEYKAGRRASHLPPISMYIFISFVFFFLNSYLNKLDLKVGNKSKVEMVKVDEGDFKDLDIHTGDSTIEAYNKYQKTLPLDKKDNILESYVNKKAIEYGSDTKKEAFGEALKHNIPKIMFILLPLFALLLKLVFYKHHHFYIEHLIYTIHLHSFLFIALALFFITKAIFPGISGLLNAAIFFIISWYIYRSLRVVYQNSRRRTIFKLSILSICYLIFVVISLLVVAIGTAILV